MMTALAIGVIFSVIDILVFMIICFVVNHSKTNFEEKKDFYKRLFWSGPKQTIKLIIFVAILNLFIEYFIFTMVFYWGPKSWRKSELECTQIYYAGEIFEINSNLIISFEDDIKSEEKEYVIAKYEEKVKITDKVPFNELFKLLEIEMKTGRVEYHIVSID